MYLISEYIPVFPFTACHRPNFPDIFESTSPIAVVHNFTDYYFLFILIHNGDFNNCSVVQLFVYTLYYLWAVIQCVQWLSRFM